MTDRERRIEAGCIASGLCNPDKHQQVCPTCRAIGKEFLAASDEVLWELMDEMRDAVTVIKWRYGNRHPFDIIRAALSPRREKK